MLIHPSLGAWDLFVELFHELYCSGSMCVGVTVWFGWGGVVSGRRLQPAVILMYRKESTFKNRIILIKFRVKRVSCRYSRYLYLHHRLRLAS